MTCSAAVRSFVSDCYTDLSWCEEPQPITLEEAEYCLARAREEGFLPVPDDLTASVLAELWNALCAGKE